MKNRISLLVMGLLFTFLMAKPAWAAFLTLTRIGTLSTSGLIYSEWSYSGVSPDFSGIATPGAMVAITVNEVTATTSAGISGVWLHKPTNIVSGTNSVSIASGNEVISFMLKYTPVASPAAVVTPIATSSGLPEAGNGAWPIIIVGGGVLVFIAGRTYKDKVAEEWNI